jgi:hypothetical protein
VHYRSLRVSSLGKWAPQLHTGLLVSGATQDPIGTTTQIHLPGCHGLRRRFPGVFGFWLIHPGGRQPTVLGLTTPHPQGLPALTRMWFRQLPVRSPLLRGYFRFLGVLRCFNSPGALRLTTVTSVCWLGCPIRKSWDQCLLTAPPRLSQLCHVLHRHAAPRHPPYAHTVFPKERPVVNA